MIIYQHESLRSLTCFHSIGDLKPDLVDGWDLSISILLQGFYPGIPDFHPIQNRYQLKERRNLTKLITTGYGAVLQVYTWPARGAFIYGCSFLPYVTTKSANKRMVLNFVL